MPEANGQPLDDPRKFMLRIEWYPDDGRLIVQGVSDPNIKAYVLAMAAHDHAQRVLRESGAMTKPNVKTTGVIPETESR